MNARGVLLSVCALAISSCGRTASRELSLRTTAGPKEAAPASAVRLSVLAIGPAITGNTLDVRVGIANLSDREVSLEYDPRIWIRGIGYVEAGAGPGLEGAIRLHSYGTGYDPGREVCHQADRIFVLKAGEETFREAQVSLERAPQGRMRMTVHIEMLRVTPGVKCEKATVLRGKAHTDIVVQPKSENPEPRPQNPDPE